MILRPIKEVRPGMGDLRDKLDYKEIQYQL